MRSKKGDVKRSEKLNKKQTDLVMSPIKLINFLDIPYDLQMESLNWRNNENVSQYFKIKERICK